GHVKGAFTGAHADKQGKFLAADGGTLFLDEINSASPGMQLKLLRVLQERRFEPVGSNETIEVDVRVILASNQALEELVASGEFRQDLYYRINVVKVEMPPLRERVGDIEALAEHFLDAQSEELGRRFTGFTSEAIDALRRYTYPGNVRELSNIIERAAVLTRALTIGIDDLPTHVSDEFSDTPFGTGGQLRLDSQNTPWVPMTLSDALIDPEREIILRSLVANDWNRQKTAEILGINRTTLYKKMKALGIDPSDHAQAG
ncbi:MAG: sigma-54-dependent Fis family transcriptional regulator, partial [Phycisphaerales bacterium]|nr:sigma-54-dependent Fis family transcriptional regulator [Phycisphaerales bacterium]